MRRRLILVFLAVSTLVASAFVVPLGFVVRRTAEDRAIDAARVDIGAVVPSLVGETSPERVESALGSTEAGQEGRLTVFMSDGGIVGPVMRPTPRVVSALDDGTSEVGGIDGGMEVVAAVATNPAELSAIRVFVPNSELREGQLGAWSALIGVGLLLIGISVLVADRLARTVVRPTQQLAAAARRLGDGDLDARVEPAGPTELSALGEVFNDLGSQVSMMLQRERELVAELSHRMRTPLTKMRMRLEQLDDEQLAAGLRTDLDDVVDEVNALITEAREPTPEMVGCDVSEVVAERASFWSVLAEDQQRPWRFERKHGSVLVAVPAADLAASLDALIENVFSHTPEGTALSIGSSLDGHFASVCVADGGPGFDPAGMERGESTAGSTGLGLDIARRMASEAGGRLLIGHSELGGAEVTMLLPVTRTTQ